MKQYLSLSQQITRIYFAAGVLLLVVMLATLTNLVILSENSVHLQRLKAIAPTHLNSFKDLPVDVQKVNPVLTLYRGHHLLPEHVQPYIDPSWLGVMDIDIEDLGDKRFEYTAFALQVPADKGVEILYALESVDELELQQEGKILFFISVVLGCIIVVLPGYLYIKNRAVQVAENFVDLTKALESSGGDAAYQNIRPETSEAAIIIEHIDNYKKQIAAALEREQSFNRYVAHELRTPLTVIKGSVAVLDKHVNQQNYDKLPDSLKKIKTAEQAMAQLINIFLQLAKQDELEQSQIELSKPLIEDQIKAFEFELSQQNTQAVCKVKSPVYLNASEILVKAVLDNLLSNAIKYTSNGTVTVTIDRGRLTVTDTGMGLNNDNDSILGHGIGLSLVKDICQKYQWQFSLEESPKGGCQASVDFGHGHRPQD